MPVLPTAPSTIAEEARATFRLAWPLILSNLAANAITTTDVLMLGWLGPRELAAAALAVNLYSLLLFTGVGLSVAISPMIAAALGRRKGAARDSRRSFRMGLWLVTFYAAAATLLLSFAEGIFLAFGQDPALSRLAGGFMDVLRWALWPTLLGFVMRNLLTAFDRAWVPLVVALGGVGVNAFLNYGLIFGQFGLPALGMQGSALATVLTNVAMLAAQVTAVVRLPRLRMMHLFARWWRADWPRFRELAKLGIPISLTWSFEVGVFSAAVYLMGLIDTISVAAHVIALQLAALMFMVPLGLSQAATVRVGYGHGAGDPLWVGRAGRVAIVLALGFALASALIMWVFPRELASLFLDMSKPESAAVLALAVQFLLIAAVFQLADGAQVIGAAILRGLHDTRVPMLFAAFGYWVVGIGAGAWLAFRTPLAGRGIWIGLALGLAVVSVLMLWRWSRREALGLVPAQSSTQTGVPTAVTA
ncbi:MATE family efflux transporter [Sphingomonas sp. LHG3406-1]|uniref:MATE family efflux transporter n=1 Tax=Sphingomonas sp. LHG3406-1 TaxID=2804617 RepID=UPI002619AC31|nr:MATE family efflux transporter [Sphingomonas sp. LHG3406-1]